ncbi:DNA-protecting protein DprA [Phormidium tenue FACHB-886]|nr:DNA-protecting protein DprA [Phormidium tenue FACHB-886]
MQDRAFWLAWSQVAGVGSILIRRLHEHFGTLERAWVASPEELQTVDGFGFQTAGAVAIARRSIDPIPLLQQHERENPYFWTPADADYPHLLLEMPDPPAVLYYQGEVNLLENQGIISAIAIVGTRSPSDYGRRWTRKLSAALAQAGFLVVSGLANGIDTEAHDSCLKAGGRTVAVMATGTDIIYPHLNRSLAKRIAQQGLLLSEYPAQTQPDRTNFPRRNRIIAGLCRATLVLEAPQKSGALITARLANEYGRDVYVLPGSLDNSRCQGCLELLNQGAQVILGEDHLLDLLSHLPRFQLQPPIGSTQQLSLLDSGVSEAIAPAPVLSPDLQQVFQTISLEPIAIDLIVQRAGLAPGLVLSALTQLELMGLVSQLPGSRYQRG